MFQASSFRLTRFLESFLITKKPNKWPLEFRHSKFRKSNDPNVWSIMNASANSAAVETANKQVAIQVLLKLQ